MAAPRCCANVRVRHFRFWRSQAQVASQAESQQQLRSQKEKMLAEFDERTRAAVMNERNSRSVEAQEQCLKLKQQHELEVRRLHERAESAQAHATQCEQTCAALEVDLERRRLEALKRSDAWEEQVTQCQDVVKRLSEALEVELREKNRYKQSCRDLEKSMLLERERQEARTMEALFNAAKEHERILAHERQRKADELDKLQQRVEQTVGKKNSFISDLEHRLEICNSRLHETETEIERQRHELSVFLE